jgi:hypothetical protein
MSFHIFGENLPRIYALVKVLLKNLMRSKYENVQAILKIVFYPTNGKKLPIWDFGCTELKINYYKLHTVERCTQFTFAANQPHYKPKFS